MLGGAGGAEDWDGLVAEASFCSFSGFASLGLPPTYDHGFNQSIKPPNAVAGAGL